MLKQSNLYFNLKTISLTLVWFENKHLLNIFKKTFTDRVRSNRVRSDRVRNDQLKNNQVRYDRVRSNRIKNDKVRSDRLPRYSIVETRTVKL